MPDAPEQLAALSALPRMGWVDQPTPVTELPALAQELGLSWLGVKRDDLLPKLHGGTKVRKLDYLLAEPRLAEAEGWVSWGAIGSGHLVAVSAAARELGKHLEAHVFWQPPSESLLNNLAFVASGPTRIHFHDSRVRLALRQPRLVLGGTLGGLPVIEVGGTTGPGMAGMARAGLELALQIEAGALPAPERIYVPLGSAGSLLGLQLGLQLGGLTPRLHAVSAVEWWCATGGRLRALQREARRWLSEQGIDLPDGPSPSIAFDRGQVGAGYGVASEASLAACRRLAEHDVASLEPIYSGKAMASLLADPPANERVLFWLTPHAAGELPVDPDWLDRLPPALRRRLDGGRRLTRRAVLVGGAALLVGGAVWRTSGYTARPSWSGTQLSAWQADVLEKCAEALLPPAPTEGLIASIPRRADRFLTTLPPHMAREVTGMFVAIEHGTTPLGHSLSRFSSLSVPEREEYLRSLAAAGGLRAQLYQGVRDMCLLGYYQQPEAWPGLQYEGPKVPREPRADRYAELVAEEGALPTGWSGA